MEIQLPRPFSRIVFRCSEQTKTDLLSRIQIYEGTMLSNELLQRTREAAKAYNERVAILVRQSIRQEEFLKSAPEIRKTFIPPTIDDGLNIIVFDPATPPQRIRVEGSEYRANLIEKTTPGHLGEGAPDTGVVKLAVVIGKGRNGNRYRSVGRTGTADFPGCGYGQALEVQADTAEWPSG